MLRILLVALWFMPFAFSADALDEVRTQFTYHGSSVHPGVVELFSNWMSDSSDPQILAVDLSTAQTSNRFDDGSYTKDDMGWLRIKRSDPDGRNSFGYHFIGGLPSGTIVLHAYEEGGGSGSFESVMMLAVNAEESVASDGGRRTRHVLRVLRTVPVGDRANAVLTIDGSTVRIDRSKAHDSEQRAPLVLSDPQLLESESASPKR